MKIFSILIETGRWLLILLFVYTGVSKYIGYHLFYSQLSAIPALQPVAKFIAIVLPAVEIITAILLVLVATEIIGWWMAALLLSAFSIYIGAMLSFSSNLPCSCGGIVAALTWKQHLLLNLILTTLCWYKLYRHYFINQFSMHTKGVS